MSKKKSVLKKGLVCSEEHPESTEQHDGVVSEENSVICNGGYNKQQICSETLLKQYDRAMDLYLHEDMLNWAKINHFFYSTGGLLFILSFHSNLDTVIPFRTLLAVISVLGCIMSIVFFIAIISGIRYMHRRKLAAKKIDDELGNITKFQVLKLDKKSNKTGLDKSITTIVLSVIPLICFAVWGFLFVRFII